MKYAHGIFGYGIASAFLAACLGIDEPGQFLLFAFGATWGHMLECSVTPPNCTKGDV